MRMVKVVKEWVSVSGKCVILLSSGEKLYCKDGVRFYFMDNKKRCTYIPLLYDGGIYAFALH